MGKFRGAPATMLLSIVLLVTCVACRSQSPDRSQTDPPIIITQEAADSLLSKVQAFAGQTSSIELSDQEVTSYIALHLAQSIPISSLEIRFSPGEAVLHGYLTKPFRTQVRLSAAAQVTGGKPRLDVTSARIGRIGIPRFLLKSLSSSITEMVQEGATHVQLEKVELENGRIIITGQVRTP